MFSEWGGPSSSVSPIDTVLYYIETVPKENVEELLAILDLIGTTEERDQQNISAEDVL